MKWLEFGGDKCPYCRYVIDPARPRDVINSDPETELIFNMLSQAILIPDESMKVWEYSSDDDSDEDGKSGEDDSDDNNDGENGSEDDGDNEESESGRDNGNNNFDEMADNNDDWLSTSSEGSNGGDDIEDDESTSVEQHAWAMENDSVSLYEAFQTIRAMRRLQRLESSGMHTR